MMNRRSLSLALACALSLSLLTACGGSGNNSSGQGGASQSGSSSVSGSTSTPDQSGGSASLPGVSQPDGSMPEGSGSVSQPSTSQPNPGDGSQQAKLSLNRADFSLFKAGATFQLKAAGAPQGTTLTWSSSDEKVATVSENGTVTYVSAGSVTITATAGDLSATCKVYCKAEQDKPASGGADSSKPDSSQPDASQPGASSKVDLSAFYTTVSGDYDFPTSMQPADKQLMDAFYPGLSAISTEQSLVYANQMSMNMGEFILIQVKDSKDVDAVKSILKSRIDAMINGGAWYPEPTRIWTDCSKVVSNGNYIMMVVNESYQAIVDDFNALF